MLQKVSSKDSAVRNLLRQATQGYHLRLNQHPLLVELTQPTLTLIKYRKLLTIYFHLYATLEDRISRYLKQKATNFNYSERKKLGWLLTDLEFFHDNPLAVEYGLKWALPEIKQVGQLIGVLYTVEGSTLGGQVISRSLGKHLGLNNTEGACFFYGYGERTSIMWQDFLYFAESISGNPIECNAAVETAGQTFQLFQQALDYSHEQL